MHSNIRKHFFGSRIVAIWNSLLNMVVSAESIITFKNRLDKFWANQEFKFNQNADNTGIGSRGINSSSYVIVEVFNFV